MAARQWADALPGLRTDTRRDEALDDPVGVDDAERRIPRLYQRPDLVDDHLQDVIDRLKARDGPGRRVEGIDDARRFLGSLAAAPQRHDKSVRVIPTPSGRVARSCGPNSPWHPASPLAVYGDDRTGRTAQSADPVGGRPHAGLSRGDERSDQARPR